MENRKYNVNKKSLIIYSVFALSLVLVCFFYFLSHYDAAYYHSTDGGFFSKAFGVQIWHGFIALIFLGIAILLKVIFSKHVKILPLILISIILPSLCYFSNYNTLKREGPLHFLVAKDGIFHFIVIGDYNLDGMNDEKYHRTYDERTVSSYYGTYEGAVLGVDSKATGIGYWLDGTCFSIDFEKSSLTLYMGKSVEYKSIEAEIKLSDDVRPEDMSFWIVDEESEKELSFSTRKGKIYMVLDSDLCKELQDSFEDEFIEIFIEYRVKE